MKNINIVSNVFLKTMRLLLLLFLLQGSKALEAQVNSCYPIELKWCGVRAEYTPYDTLLYINLESACYEDAMPVYVSSFPMFDDQVKVQAELIDVKTVPLTNEEMALAEKHFYSSGFELEALPLRSRNEALLRVKIVPFRQNAGRYEKLLSAVLSVSLTPDFGKAVANPTYAEQSAMSSGDWYKIGLLETGVYKLTYSDLNELGVDLSGIDPRTIRVYHNGGGVLPELNAEARHDDLVEVPIYVEGETDGRFDQNDYILFYGCGPTSWKYNASRSAFEHVANAYDDYAYAFVVTGQGNGKRINEMAAPSGNANVTVSEFIDYQLKEAKEYNLNNSGRTFYGDKMEGNSTRTYSFEFPNAIATRPVSLHVAIAGRNYKPATFEVFVDNNKMTTYQVGSVTPNGLVKAIEVGGWLVSYPKSDEVNIKYKYNTLVGTTAEGYLNYLALNAWRNLVFTGTQMCFRNPEASDVSKVYEYRLTGATQQVQLWNVSDPVAPSVVRGGLSGNVLSFSVNGRPDNAFVAFDGSGYCVAKPFGKVDNQNLHSVRDVDYLIVVYPEFMSQAERLKAIHAQYSPDLNVFITTPEKIYNEFSCGAKDITAIHDFCRMLYLDSSSGRELKYLLLLGDCSFDYKNRAGVVDFVPTYETVTSLNLSTNIVTDDYFGFMDPSEGGLNTSLADIGIGRFPVSTLEQATQMVDKVERYIEMGETTMRPWRNVVTFFADDENVFVENSETLADLLKNIGGEAVVVDKIYLDAFQQESSPGGEVCPQMNAALNSRMEKGTLVLHYMGHGGEVQLADEKILQRRDVDSWRNGPMFPLMITGTCEFSRYDDHMRTSLGEYAFLNPYGGMVAMFTTSRVTGGTSNMMFCRNIYNNLFRLNGGEHNCLGDVYRMGKTNGGDAEKRYVFFGDPALRLAYPKLQVETMSINGKYPGYDLDSVQVNDTMWQTYPRYHDTISALQPVEIEGVVKDLDGHVAEGFNGVMYVSVYDKEAELATLGMGTDPPSSVIPFKLRNSIVFNGQTEVKNGRFKIDFIVPRDLAYRFGKGMISYYATDYSIDANGKCEEFIIGGFYDEAIEDNDPPQIRLFIDDTLFVSGSITGENPLLLAYVEDESGINTTGSGIGHDIVATLTGASRGSYCLNDYFTSDISNSGKGVIKYKMLKLEDGDYTLTLKVWDVFNNSSTASIDFTVVNSAGMGLDNLANYPNPVTDVTDFVFDHNQVGNNLKVQIDIFDIMGRWVNRLTETIYGTSVRSTPIRWDGRGANGESLRNGVYVYRILTTNDQGETASLVSKLILNK